MSVLDERAEVEREIEGSTICDALRETARRYPDGPAFSQRVDSEWQTLTWADTRRRVLETAAAFVAVGLEPGEAVALMMANRTEHVLADLGAVHAGGVPTTVYGTFAADQVRHIADDCAAAYAVLEGADQLDRWLPVLAELPGLRTVIVLDPAACPSDERFMTWQDFVRIGARRLAAESDEVERRCRAVEPDAPVTVLYTSGTTGTPKGVIVTHRMALYECAISGSATALPAHNVGISYLPFAHIADRVLSIYMPILRAAHIYMCPDPSGLAEALRVARPHGFFGVPRVWEKMMAMLQAALAAEPDQERRSAVEAAMEAGRAHVAASEYGREMPSEVAEAYAVADADVLSGMRALIGLDRVRHTVSASAPLPIEVARFFAGLGLRILDVYGMTETTGAVTANTPDAFKLGTVGRAMPGVELRLAADGEIMVRGTTCTPGYLNRPEATAELLDEERWVRTGDIGTLDGDGFLSVVDRKKEIIITAGGENVPPSHIENLLKEHPMVGQALAYGDRRPYIVAVITLDGEVAPVWARTHGIDDADLAALGEHPAVREEVAAAVEAANTRLARSHRVKAWRLLPGEWTAESEELTPSLKLRRRVVHEKYADVFDAMYASEGAP